MRRDFADAARALLGTKQTHGDAAKQLAERAEQTCQQLAHHLARLLGATGVQMLLKRSLVQASGEFDWLAVVRQDASLSVMRSAMEHQIPEMIADAFVVVLAAFVGLLERLIGEGLVDRLLAEVWPAVFTLEAKDTP